MADCALSKTMGIMQQIGKHVYLVAYRIVSVFDSA